MNKLTRVARFLTIALLSTVVAGCFSWGGGEEEDTGPHYYIIDVDRGSVANSFAKQRVLQIKPVRVISQFRGKELIFRVGENEYQRQTQHELFSEPSEMLTEQLQRWLQKSGLFSQVTVNADIPADFVLETAVTALYGERRDNYSPEAVLEMQFFLSEAESAKAPVFQTGLQIGVDIEETTPSNVVSGLKQGLRELLTTLEQDFSQFFSKRKVR